MDSISKKLINENDELLMEIYQELRTISCFEFPEIPELLVKINNVRKNNETFLESNALNSISFPEDVINICKSFAMSHGKQWRSKMIKRWNANPETITPEIQRVRNVAGPQGIYKIKIEG